MGVPFEPEQCYIFVSKIKCFLSNGSIVVLESYSIRIWADSYDKAFPHLTTVASGQVARELRDRFESPLDHLQVLKWYIG